MATEEESATQKRIDWDEFMREAPPGTERRVFLPDGINQHSAASVYDYDPVPDIKLHCDSGTCGGARLYASQKSYLEAGCDTWKGARVRYICKNCGQNEKAYALQLRGVEPVLNRDAIRLELRVDVRKLGEWPPFRPRVDPKVLNLAGPDVDLLKKGLHAESLGLGMGAFAYYRRVVENQKGRLIDEIIKVAKRSPRPDDAMIRQLIAAKSEQQFSRAVEEIKDAIPESLWIRGQNPLTLLHTATSKGLHNLTDAECLELAKEVRLVLTVLSENLRHALRDDTQIKQAIGKLTRKRASK